MKDKSFFDQVYESLFPRKEQKNKLLLHEPIKRSEAYLKKYESWQRSHLRTLILKEIAAAYQLKEQGIVQKPEVHVLRSSNSNGFVVSYDPGTGSEEFQYLFDWLADTVEKLGYKRSNSDVAIIHREGFIETREKHYLKPNVDRKAPISQRFGNILIEHILVDGNPSFVKLMAHTYNDRSYAEPERFESLAKYLFGLT